MQNNNYPDWLADYAPPFTEENDAHIRAITTWQTVHKRQAPFRMARRIALAAVIALSILALSATALAAIFHVDLGRIYNSFFGETAVPERVDIDKIAVSDGVSVRVASVVSDGTYINLLLEISDPLGTRLVAPIKLDFERARYDVIQFSEAEISEDGTTATIALTLIHQLPHSSADRLIISNIISGISRVSEQELTFNFAENVEISPETVVADGWSQGQPGVMTAVEDTPRFLVRDRLAVVIPEFPWITVTNAGIIDGELHVQYKYAARAEGVDGSNHLQLLADGALISETFRANEGEYSEIVFPVSDTENVTLIGSSTTGEHFLKGPWDVSFEVPSDNIAGKISRSFISPKTAPYAEVLTSFDFTISTIHTDIHSNTYIGPYSPDVGNEVDQNAVLAEVSGVMPEIDDIRDGTFITLKDGTRVDLTLGSISGDAWGSVFELSSGYFDLAQLYSVTFLGSEFIFD